MLTFKVEFHLHFWIFLNATSMNNYTLFSVTSLNVSTQRVLFLKQQIKTTASISFCFIHSFFSSKNQTYSTGSKNSSTSEDYIFYSIFKHTRKNRKSKVKIKHNWLKTENSCFSASLFIYIVCTPSFLLEARIGE